MQRREKGYLQAGACCKHFAVYDVENFPTARYFYNAVVDGRNLWETYLPAFEACAKEAGGSHVMCSYNAINGVPACAEGALMNGVLRDKWNWTGFVVSDYDAWAQIQQTHEYCPNMTCAAAVGINAGMDQEGGGQVAIDQLPAAVAAGLVTPARIRQAFIRNFRLRFELGMFDPPEFSPFAAVPYSHLQSSAHMQLSLKAARESIGLYKNDKNTLPLTPPAPGNASSGLKIAVIGPAAANTAWLQGNYAVYPTHGVVSVLEGITNANCGGSRPCNFDVQGVAYNLPNDTYVLVATPEECCSACNGDLSCNFFTFREGKCFLLGDSYAAAAVADQRVVSGARFGLCLTTYGTTYVALGDAAWPAQDPRECCQLCRSRIECTLWSYDSALELCFLNPTGSKQDGIVTAFSGGPATRNPLITFEPGCIDGVVCTNTSGFDKAVAAAASADVVVLVLGLGQAIESEGNDRRTIDLPENQYALAAQVVAAAGANTRVVGVFVHGGTIAFKNLTMQLDAIVDAWYPAQQGGNAIADVLFGYYSPAGRATVTYYTANTDLPPNLAQQDLYPNTTSGYLGLTYRYYTGNVTIPFGYGISYTSFLYSNLSVSSSLAGPCDLIDVNVTVTNVGSVYTSDEVVQVYVKQPLSTVPTPQLRLGAFARVRDVAPGESRQVRLQVPPKFRAVVVENVSAEPILGSSVVTVPGTLTLIVGGGQPGFATTTSASVVVQTGGSIDTC
jgi:beta-glucosidase